MYSAMWEEAGLTEKHKLLMAMLDAVYVDTVEEKSVVAIRPKPAFRPIFPEEDAREVMELADLNVEIGLVGDTWQDRPSIRSGDGKAHPDMQIALMNSRVADLVA